MIKVKSETVYVNPQQLRRQKERRDDARKVVDPTPDPALVLAKAWKIGKPHDTGKKIPAKRFSVESKMRGMNRPDSRLHRQA
jgi:hypothetical protein